MFSGITTGLRSVRTSLLNGYGTMLIGWIHWPWLEERFGLGALAEDPLSLRFEALLRDLGSTAQLGALTFGAVMLGSVVHRLLMGPVLTGLERLAGLPRWDLWVAPRLENVRRYGETDRTSFRFGISMSGQDKGFPESADRQRSSRYFEQHLWESYKSAQQDQDEARFRLNLIVLAALFGISMIGQSPWWMGIGGSMLVLLGAELSIRNRVVTKSMTKIRLQEIDEERSLENLAEAFGRLVQDDPDAARGVIRDDAFYKVLESKYETQQVSKAAAAAKVSSFPSAASGKTEQEQKIGALERSRQRYQAAVDEAKKVKKSRMRQGRGS